MADRHHLPLLPLLLALCLACGGGGGGGSSTGSPTGGGGGTTTGGTDNSGGGTTGGGGTSGGTSGGGGSTVAGGGIGGTGISFGPITGFGSIFVNGREIFLTGDTAVADDDGNPLDETDLGLGQVVRTVFVTNAQNRAVAQEVTTIREVKGPVDAVDAAAGTLTVLGRTVVPEPPAAAGSGIFEADGTPLALADLAPGNLVEVSGLVDGQGLLHATRIERQAAATPADELLETRGTVSRLDTSGHTFQLGGILVDYAAAERVDADLAEGAFVEVKGRRTANAIAAVEVKAKEESPLAGELGTEAGAEVELEGFVARLTAGGFEVNGVTVVTDGATAYEGGTAAGLAAGARVEVKGRLDAQGRVAAETVAFEDGGEEGSGSGE